MSEGYGMPGSAVVMRPGGSKEYPPPTLNPEREPEILSSLASLKNEAEGLIGDMTDLSTKLTPVLRAAVAEAEKTPAIMTQTPLGGELQLVLGKLRVCRSEMTRVLGRLEL